MFVLAKGVFGAIECGIVEVEVAFVACFILCNSEAIAEALVMHDLTGAEEADDVLNVRVIGKAEDIVVSEARFLLGGKVFVNVGKDVARDRE